MDDPGGGVDFPRIPISVYIEGSDELLIGRLLHWYKDNFRSEDRQLLIKLKAKLADGKALSPEESENLTFLMDIADFCDRKCAIDAG
jgi:hypothetical protein